MNSTSGIESALVRGSLMGINGVSQPKPSPMARNLFLLSSLALIAGCTSPTEPPSSSGVEDFAPSGPALNAPVTTVPAAPATPAAVPASGKLPLGPRRLK